MTTSANRTIALSTEINRSLFDGNLERTLLLIGDLMRASGLTVSARALAAIPVQKIGPEKRPIHIPRPTGQRAPYER